MLNNVKIETRDQVIELCGTDSEIALRYEITDGVVEDPGLVSLPVSQLAGIFRETAEQDVSFSAEGNICEVRTADSIYRVLGEDPQTFPFIPFIEEGEALELPVPLLLDAIRKTAFATARERTRYALNGVLCRLEGKQLELVATDGKRMSLVRREVPTEAREPVEVIVPKKSLELLEKISSVGEAYQIHFRENLVQFRLGQITVCAKLVEGTFPNYRQVIPTEFAQRLQLPTQALASAIRRASWFISEDSRAVQLQFGSGGVLIRSQSEASGEAEIRLGLEYEGPDRTLAFNPEFVMDILRVFADEQFTFAFSEGNQPVLLTTGEDHLNVIMPITHGT